MTMLQGRHLKRLGGVKVYVVTEDAPADTGLPAGSVVIPRGNASKPFVYQTIYDALRSRIEILVRYGAHEREGAGAELAALDDMRRLLIDTHVCLAGDDAAAAAGALEKLEASLRRKTNRFKKEAHEKASKGVVRTVKAGVNRGATRARATAIDDRLVARQEEVRSIAPWIGAMETALMLELRRSLRIVADLDRASQALLHHPLFRNGATSLQQKEAIAARLFLVRRDVDTLLAAPFLSLRRAVDEPTLEAIGAVRAGDGLALKDRLVSLAGAAGRAIARHRIEGVVAFVALAIIGARDIDAVPRAVEKARVDIYATLDRAGPVERRDAVDREIREALEDLFQTDLTGAKDHLKAASRQLS